MAPKLHLKNLMTKDLCPNAGNQARKPTVDIAAGPSNADASCGETTHTTVPLSPASPGLGLDSPGLWDSPVPCNARLKPKEPWLYGDAACSGAAASGGAGDPQLPQLAMAGPAAAGSKAGDRLNGLELVATRSRLLEAITAEQDHQVAEIVEKLKCSDELFSGLWIQPQYDVQLGSRKVFKAYIPTPDFNPEYARPMPLPNWCKRKFKPGTSVTVLQSLDVPEESEVSSDYSPSPGCSDLSDAELESSDEGDFGGNAPRRFSSRPGPSNTKPDQAREVQDDVAQQLASMGLKKCFQATVKESTDGDPNVLVLSSRYDVVNLVLENQNTRYVIVSSIDDVTFRRQRAAAEALHILRSVEPTKDGELKSRPDEVRVRKIVTSGGGKSEDSMCNTAAKRVTWMTDKALRQLTSMLEADDGLNEEQRTLLLQAAKASVTLLKGPPGTGKSRTMVSMIKAMCRVFVGPPALQSWLTFNSNGNFAQRHGFLLPSRDPLHKWEPLITSAWLGSLLAVDEGKEGDLHPQRVAGVTPQIKAWLQKSLAAEPGQLLKTLASSAEHTIKAKLQSALRAAGVSATEAAMDEASAGAAAKACAPVLKSLLGKLVLCLDTPRVVEEGYNGKGSDHCEMRILVSADTNVAVDNLLRGLDSDEGFMQCGYNIVRLGSADNEKMDRDLAKKYCTDSSHSNHPLLQAYKLMMEAIQPDQTAHEKLTQDGFLDDMIARLFDVAEQWDKEASECTQGGRMMPRAMRERLQRLAGGLRTDVAPSIKDEMKKYIKLDSDLTKLSGKRGRNREHKGSSRQASKQAKVNAQQQLELKRKMESARKSTEKSVDRVRKMLTYYLVTKAQVIVGTNTSMGELADWKNDGSHYKPDTQDSTEDSTPEPTEAQAVEDMMLCNTILFLDEAGQATESSSMVPLVLGPEWVLMAADLKQLRPTIKSDRAKEALGYYTKGSGSLYGRLCQMGLPEQMLTTQYRMHPGIREFPSTTFYEGQLREDTRHMQMQVPAPHVVARSRAPDVGPASTAVVDWWPFQKMAERKEIPVAFFHVTGVEEKGGRADLATGGSDFSLRHSYMNEEEASAALRLALLMGTDPTVKTIAIVSPYKAQVHFLMDKLSAGEGYLRQQRDRGAFFPTVKVYSIDGCQGQEADVVIVTTVRSSMSGRHIGHVADARRLNVAITRAKRALLVVGNKVTLKAVTEASVDKGAGDVTNFWARWLNWVESKGCLVEADQVEQYLNPTPTRPIMPLPRAMCVTVADFMRIKGSGLTLDSMVR